MNIEAKPPKPESRTAGPLQWRSLVSWMRTDGVINEAEALRIHARCAQAESVQHPLLRLANVTVHRAKDDKLMDIEALTAWLAKHLSMDYVRIDPLKVEVGRVADAMTAAYAERHSILPLQLSPHEIVVATSEPLMTDWVAEVERQSRRTVRRVLASPQDIKRYTV